MSFAILKNRRGQPVALFEVERETAKRIYGRVADTLDRDSWFWLTGLTKIRGGESYAIKEIVLCYIGSDNAWHSMKDNFRHIVAAHKEVYNRINSDLNDAREKARELEQENDVGARKAYELELEKYVCKADLL